MQCITGKKALGDIKSVMQFIDKQAIGAGITPKDLMTQIEANSCYHHTEASIWKLNVSYVVKFVRCRS